MKIVLTLAKFAGIFTLCFATPLIGTYSYAADFARAHLDERALPTPPRSFDSRSGKNFSEGQLDFNSATHLANVATADQLATELDAQFQNLMRTQMPRDCNVSSSERYALKLFANGDFQTALDYIASCAPTVHEPDLFLVAAEIEMTRFDYVQADHFYSIATDEHYRNSASYKSAVYEYASFAILSPYESKVDAILARAFLPSETGIWKALVARTSNLDPKPFTRNEVSSFLSKQLLLSQGKFLNTLRIAKLNLDEIEYNYDGGLRDLKTFAPTLEGPLDWYNLAYNITYRAFDQDFALSRKIYDVYDRYAKAFWAFPTESNTYNYTEIYNHVCTANLLGSQDGVQLNVIKAKIRMGELSAKDALTQLEPLAKKFSSKADVMTTYGGLLALNGRHEEATNAYWAAHRACRYFNRANWGLAVEDRFRMYSQLPEYRDADRTIDQGLRNRKIPEDIATYIINWNAFDAETQRRIEYGSRIWLPYMKTLQETGKRTYIKFSFDLLSESPGLDTIRDERIGGIGYPNDNRLWDDVRGLGGDTVIADVSQVFQTVQGDYNLLGHEMTHQFQRLLEEKLPAGTPNGTWMGLECVIDLYAAARSRNVFPDAYSAQNKEEYFAQGVTYWLVPESTPQRFGLNHSWLVANDPGQLRFIDSIENAGRNFGGDLERITCRPNPSAVRTPRSY